MSLEANHKQYSGNFDATVEYLINQVLYHQVNKQLNIAWVGSGASGCLQTCDDQGNNLEMPLISYSSEEWAQLSCTQKSSICKRHTATDGEQHKTCHRVHGRRGRGGGNRKCQHENRHNCNPKSAGYHALVKSVATLSKNVNVMAAHMSGKYNKDKDAKPAADGKMASNAKNSSLCKTPKKEKE